MSQEYFYEMNAANDYAKRAESAPYIPRDPLPEKDPLDWTIEKDWTIEMGKLSRERLERFAVNAMGLLSGFDIFKSMSAQKIYDLLYQIGETYPKESEGTCVWEQVEHRGDMRYWETSCDRKFHLADGNALSDSGMIYCCYCNRLIEEVKR